MTTALNLVGGLNPSQIEAVQQTEGPLLVLAGAGSGKTRVLTHRLVKIISEGLAAPHEILAVTFTNKAAREMEERAIKILRDAHIPVYERLWITTFHSACVRILRSDIHRLGYPSFFNIYDSADQLAVVKRVVEQLDLNDKIYSPKGMAAFVNDSKMRAQTPQDVAREKSNSFLEKSALVYERYEQEMRQSNALDFGDLLLKTLQLFQGHPEVLEHYRNQFKYVMVDEYQDTNRIQYLLTSELAKLSRNLCVVGDEDQSIYSWRGADIRNILDFEKDFPDTKIIKLEENYRSTANIVKAASALIAQNSLRKGKTLFTNNSAGELIRIRLEDNEYEEARFVAKTIAGLKSESEISLRDIAIFYRTNAQSRVLEEQLRQQSVPYRLVGGVKFYDRMEVKDLVAYLKLIANDKDGVAALRIINVPARGIGKTTLEKLEAFAFTNNVSILESIPKVIELKMVNSGTAAKLKRFLDLFIDLQKQAQNLKLSELYHLVLEQTQYIQFLKNQDAADAENRIQNLEELDNALAHFEKERGEEATLQSFLEELALVSDADEVDAALDSVTMMTLHISKGLEFPVVFMVGMEEGLFPSAQRASDLDGSEIEEERRLCYVGMTRARKRLFLTHAKTRKVWGQDQSNPPSRFLREIPQEYVESSSGRFQPRFLQRYQERTRTNEQFNELDPFPDYENEATGSSNSLGKGARVRHPTFGVGTIYKTEGQGDEQKVSILFHDNSIRKFVVKHARLEPI